MRAGIGHQAQFVEYDAELAPHYPAMIGLAPGADLAGAASFPHRMAQFANCRDAPDGFRNALRQPSRINPVWAEFSRPVAANSSKSSAAPD